jgi:hypothetical protein
MKHLDAIDIASIVANDTDIDRIAVMVMHAYHPDLCANSTDKHRAAKAKDAYALAALCLAAKDEIVSCGLTVQASNL